MAIAGRVAIVPKGEWSQSVTYDKLDLVTYNGNTFIAYKSSVGVEPVDGDTWMLVMQGIDPQDIENIIDGTTPVGDSNKLGGKGASEYLTKVIPKNSFITFENDDASTLEGNVKVEIGNNYFRVYEASGKNRGFSIDLSKCADWIGAVLATTADLANYLPLTGGKMTKELLSAYDDQGVGVVLGSEGVFHLAMWNSYGQGDATRNELQIYAPSKASDIAQALKLINVVSGKKTEYNILHTGNKPTGTYTGNGSATREPINTGGIGEALLISSTNGFAIITYYGVLTTETISSKSEANFRNGVLTLASTSNVLNKSGATYRYQVL